MIKGLKQRLRDSGVAIIYLFGSKAVGNASPASDMDIGVVLKVPPSGKDTRALYQSLYEIFSEMFPKVELDIVFLQNSPLSLQYSALSGGRILFEEDPVFTVDYENRVVNFYLDFRPVLDFFDRITLKRYAEA